MKSVRLILTHEQADFDALASLMGASLLDEGALPILPQRINRNVRIFLTRFRDKFSFVNSHELGKNKIESIMIVDTQSLNMVKGMGTQTRIQVLDHHKRRANLPKNWQVTITECGATSTFLVEALQKNQSNLSSLQATLFLLGIYEDTGSLTYSSTTPRDIHAVAFLLEKGASLKVANDFLNMPLLPEEIAVYNQLIAGAKTHIINGHRVIVANCEVKDNSSEVSSIVNKLSNLFHFEALFVLVSTTGGIHIVARSTTDEIDVAEVATYFGGGGHPRAASAFINPTQPLQGKITGKVPIVDTPNKIYEVILMILSRFLVSSDSSDTYENSI